MRNNPLFYKFLPKKIREALEGRKNLGPIIESFSWVLYDKVVRMGVGLLVGVWVARYLGPAYFGVLNYATAIVGFLSVVSALGLNTFVIRRLLGAENEKTTILGTAVCLQFFTAILSVALAFLTVSALKPNDDLIKTLVLILSLTLLIKPSEVVKYWFESQTQSKYSIIIESSLIIAFSIIRMIFIKIEASLQAFTWLIVHEALTIALFLVGFYSIRMRDLRRWRFDSVMARSLLAESWPLMLSGLAAILYMKLDQIMLGQMLGNDAVGVFSAASRISEIWYFVPMGVFTSVFPTILRLKKIDEQIYLEKIQKIYDLFILASIVFAALTNVAAAMIIRGLYGTGYAESADILSVQVWNGVFVTMGVLRSIWLITEGLQSHAMRYMGISLLVNFLANLYLIPEFGGVGAAWSSVFAQATTALVAPSLFQETRPSVKMLLKSVNPLRWKNTAWQSLNSIWRIM